MAELTWVRDGPLDMMTGTHGEHEYCCIRNWCDVAILKYNGERLRTSPSDGGHSENMKFAETHFRNLIDQEGKSDGK